MAAFPGPPGWAGARRKLFLDFMVLGRITRDRHSDNPGWRHSIQTNQLSTSISPPHFYTGRPSCCNPPNNMLNGYSSLGGGECSLEADRIPSLQSHVELLKQKTGFSGITDDVADACLSISWFNSIVCWCHVPAVSAATGYKTCVCDRSLITVLLRFLGRRLISHSADFLRCTAQIWL